MVGGTFTGSTLTNRSAVERAMASKFESFGRWYMGTRHAASDVWATRSLLGPAAADVAREFVDWLLRRVRGAGAGRGSHP